MMSLCTANDVRKEHAPELTDAQTAVHLAASKDFRWAACSADYWVVSLVAGLAVQSVVVMVAS